ncbi:MAG TPA: hypothetical protein VHF22_01740 [Planctomycetota bacterium]|nr:hypothetical protein [Planctomycetota bacterium]
MADNRLSEIATWDDEGLQAVLRELQAEDMDVEDFELAGFDEDELAELLADDGQGATDPDAVPEAPDEAITQPGDLWILGDHRLLCGDSSKAADVDRLLAGAVIHLVNTDPPYNVKVEPRSNNAIAAGLSSFPASSSAIEASDAQGMHHQGFDLARHKTKSKRTTKKLRAKDRPLANDFVSDEEFDRMLRAWFGNMARVLLPGRSFYIWGGYPVPGYLAFFVQKPRAPITVVERVVTRIRGAAAGLEDFDLASRAKGTIDGLRFQPGRSQPPVVTLERRGLTPDANLWRGEAVYHFLAAELDPAAIFSLAVGQ